MDLDLSARLAGTSSKVRYELLLARKAVKNGSYKYMCICIYVYMYVYTLDRNERAYMYACIEKYTHGFLGLFRHYVDLCKARIG